MYETLRLFGRILDRFDLVVQLSVQCVSNSEHGRHHEGKPRPSNLDPHYSVKYGERSQNHDADVVLLHAVHHLFASYRLHVVLLLRVDL